MVLDSQMSADFVYTVHVVSLIVFACVYTRDFKNIFVFSIIKIFTGYCKLIGACPFSV